MLVLTRKLGSTIYAKTASGEIVEFKILEVRGDRVRVGVTAARDIAIHRDEVAAKIAEWQEPLAAHQKGEPVKRPA